MTAPSNVNASTTGRLESLPMCELVAYALYRKLSGSFAFESPHQQKSMLVVNQGQVTKVHTAQPLARLGELLTASGQLDQPGLERALAAAARKHVPLGAALLELAAISPGALAGALREQSLRRVSWIGCLPESSSFAYYSGVDLLSEQPAVDVDALALIARCVRQAPPLPRIEQVLDRLRGHSLKLHRTAEPNRLELSPDQRALAEALKQRPRPLDALGSALQLSTSRQLVYLLVLTRQLQVISGAHSEAAPPEASGVSGPPPSAAPPSIPSGLDAAGAFRLAEECMKRHQLDKAFALAERAHELDGEQPEYQALLAWLRAQRQDPKNARAAHAILSSLNQAIRRAPNNPRIRYYRGQVFKRLGRTEDALKDFRFSARQDPKNLDAIRELRLHHMRSEPPPGKASGVFAKLFGR